MKRRRNRCISIPQRSDSNHISIIQVCPRLRYFNPSKVWFKRRLIDEEGYEEGYFNPSKVWFKLSIRWLPHNQGRRISIPQRSDSNLKIRSRNSDASGYFNPSKVWFKRMTLLRQYLNHSLFQSLKGLIQTLSILRDKIEILIIFQSLKGLIQTFINFFLHLFHSLFQSLKGLIQTQAPTRGAPSSLSFQSLKGLIQTKEEVLSEEKEKDISIPQRSDSNGNLSPFLRCSLSYFNPSKVWFKLIRSHYVLIYQLNFNPSKVWFKQEFPTR